MADMYDIAPDAGQLEDSTAAEAGPEVAEQKQAEAPEQEQALVKRILKTIRGDIEHHKESFKQMRNSMFMAQNGRAPDWPKTSYKANIAGQHVRQKTAANYAKNPKVVAKRKETMDFVIWDETQASLTAAMQMFQQGQLIMAATPPTPVVDPMTGAPAIDPMTGAPAMAPPPAPPGFAEAQALIADVQQGMQRRMMLKRLGRTMEIVFGDAMRQQTPLDFKASMKKTVRRACTSAVGYVEMGYQRKYGIPEAVTESLADFRERLARINQLAHEASEQDQGELLEERAELEASITALEQQPQIILRSGLTFDFLQSTQVIPDRRCTSLVGFVGARHMTIRYTYTKAEVERKFNCDLGESYTPYTLDGKSDPSMRGVDTGDDGQSEINFGDRKSSDSDLVRVFKHYDKTTGVVYHVCDGHKRFLTPPSAPTVSVPRFWPIYALTFNEVENEDEIFPPSDIELLWAMQNEINRSRQGKREHRNAARPRWVYSKGALDAEQDVPNFEAAEAFEMFEINKEQGVKLSDILEPVPVPGVDPNLYDTGEVLQDAQMTVGAQAAQLGGLSKATATEAAIAEDSSNVADSSAIDDLDTFLTMIARDAGQVLLTNMTKEEVVRIAGVGAVWVEDIGLSPEDIFEEVYLEIEAGSTGKPNQASEIRRVKELMPIILQMPGLSAEYITRDVLRRYDDRLDLTEAIVAGMPSIMAQNRMAQVATGDPATEPTQQGAQGGDKAPPPRGDGGSGPAFGNNQLA